jgi:hypothetical protein
MSLAITPREWYVIPTASNPSIFERYNVAKAQLRKFERNYRGLPTIEWTQANAHIPITIAGFYLAFVYLGPRFMNGRKAMRLKPLFATWNLLLSLFSFLGASRLLPALASGVMDKGLQYTVCGRPQEWVMDGPAGLWLTLFIFSKIPELIDTAFLVIRKKPVIFLHWYHHFTVMLYCWHALDTTAAPGIWFAAMNYFVHSIMYAYYFATNVGLYKYVRPIAPALTTLQILQMVGGTAILCRCAWTFVQRGQTHCHIVPSNLAAGLGMYLSYFALFALFFAGKYCSLGGGREQDAGFQKLQVGSTNDARPLGAKTTKRLRSASRLKGKTATP